MILTLIDERTNRENCDVEIPDEMTADGFIRQWLHGLASVAVTQEETGYLAEGKEPDGVWFSIPGHMRLAESGLQEGAYIRIKLIYSTAAEPVQEESSILLFRDRTV